MPNNSRKAAKSAKPKNPPSVFTKAKLLSGFVGVITAFVVWHFPHCYEERKEAIPEVRNAFADRTSAQDQMAETMDTAVKATYRLVDYVKYEKTINPQVVQHQISQLASLYQDANAACTRAIQAINHYADAENTLSQEFLSERDIRAHKEDGKRCSFWNDNFLSLVSFDPTKLNDKSFRDGFIARLEQERLHSQSVVESLNKFCDSCANNMENELNYAETRRFSMTNTCWDCMKRLFNRF
jgi:hypothetical protein